MSKNKQQKGGDGGFVGTAVSGMWRFGEWVSGTAEASGKVANAGTAVAKGMAEAGTALASGAEAAAAAAQTLQDSGITMPQIPEGIDADLLNKSMADSLTALEGAGEHGAAMMNSMGEQLGPMLETMGENAGPFLQNVGASLKDFSQDVGPLLENFGEAAGPYLEYSGKVLLEMSKEGAGLSFAAAKDMGAFLAKPTTIRLMLDISLETLKLYITYRSIFCAGKRGWVQEYDRFYGLHCRWVGLDETDRLDLRKKTLEKVLKSLMKNEKKLFKEMRSEVRTKLKEKIVRPYYTTKAKKSIIVWSNQELNKTEARNPKASLELSRALTTVHNEYKKILNKEKDFKIDQVQSGGAFFYSSRKKGKVAPTEILTNKEYYEEKNELLKRCMDSMNEIESRLMFATTEAIEKEEEEIFNQKNINLLKKTIEAIKKEKKYAAIKKAVKTIDEYIELIHEKYSVKKEILLLNDKISEKETDLIQNYENNKITNEKEPTSGGKPMTAKIDDIKTLLSEINSKKGGKKSNKTAKFKKIKKTRTMKK